MKLSTIIKQLFLYAVLPVFFLVTSCIPQPQTQVQAYYEFRGDDFDKLLDFELYQEITFQNNFGETLIYQVDGVTDDFKKQHASGGGAFLGFSVPVSYYFYFDRSTISFNVIPSVYDIEYDYERYPVDVEQAQNNPYTELSSEFIGQVFFANWNGLNNWGGTSGASNSQGIDIDYEDETTTMTINDKIYDNVYVLESGNPEPFVNGVIVNTVNVIYYDKYHGIIGFDETDGKEWRIVN